MRKNHKNDKRRITARERVAKHCFDCGGLSTSEMQAIARMLAKHARAAVARYKRKRICVLKVNDGFACSRLRVKCEEE